MPYFFIADGAFPFTNRIMKPYCPRSRLTTIEERTFNYRLSRARRCIENSFGILSTKWLCLSRTIFCGPDRAQQIVGAFTILHNYLLINNKNYYCPTKYADSYNQNGELIEGEWRQNTGRILHPISHNFVRGRVSTDPYRIRNHLSEYVNSPIGSLSWQQNSIFKK